MKPDLRKQYIGIVRQMCFELYRYSCMMCFMYNPKYLELEELHGRKKGNYGLDAITPENCIPLCRDCHTIVDKFGRAQLKDGETVSKHRVMEYLRNKLSGVRSSQYLGRTLFMKPVTNPYFGERVHLMEKMRTALKGGNTAEEYLGAQLQKLLAAAEEEHWTFEAKIIAQWRDLLTTALDNEHKQE